MIFMTINLVMKLQK